MFVAAVVVLAIVDGAIIYAGIKFRERPGHIAKQFHGHNLLELTWTIIPTIMVVSFSVLSWQKLDFINNTRGGDVGMVIQAEGAQWAVELQLPARGPLPAERRDDLSDRRAGAAHPGRHESADRALGARTSSTRSGSPRSAGRRTRSRARHRPVAPGRQTGDIQGSVPRVLRRRARGHARSRWSRTRRTNTPRGSRPRRSQAERFNSNEAKAAASCSARSPARAVTRSMGSTAGGKIPGRAEPDPRREQEEHRRRLALTGERREPEEAGSRTRRR